MKFEPRALVVLAGVLWCSVVTLPVMALSVLQMPAPLCAAAGAALAALVFTWIAVRKRVDETGGR